MSRETAPPHPPVAIDDPDPDLRAAAARRVGFSRLAMLASLEAWPRIKPGPTKDELLSALLAEMDELRSALLSEHAIHAPRRGRLP